MSGTDAPSPSHQSATPWAGPFRDPDVPAELLWRWFQAEERLYPVVMVMPERYETVVSLVGRVEAGDAGLEGRRGGAGPSDSGMLWIEGVAVTVPTDTDFARSSPSVLRPEDDGTGTGGFGIWRDGVRLAAATGAARPRYYDLS